MDEQFEQRKVEPNSGLGQALRYLLKHWDELTLFLRRTGAPLDNNGCERALKRAILHHMNSLFYRTANGAEAGDLSMSSSADGQALCRQGHLPPGRCRVGAHRDRPPITSICSSHAWSSRPGVWALGRKFPLDRRLWHIQKPWPSYGSHCAAQ